MIFSKQSEFLKTINNWGFNTNKISRIVNGVDKIENFHKEVNNLRSTLDYDIDGIVFKVNDLNLQERLGILLIHLDGQLPINFLQKKQ